MKLLLVGANGTLGQAVANEMKTDAEIISAGRTNADVEVDITSTDSIQAMFETVGEVDALVCTAGAAHFGPVEDMTPEQNLVAVNSKLLGQINLVLLGLDYIRENGSITLITGILMDDPIVKASSSAMANGGVRAFVKSAAIELPKNIRINNVSPTMVIESEEKYGPLFKGFKPREAKDVGLAFKKSILGAQSGQTYEVY
ncbi:short chain dehydrogenase [Alteribacillus bidgolensis]|uniref:NAD(P)-dependent dehydrogenase, short-chain alcohol dehydrogenase family n=1 Tax=Alteribacillus bidgolensis TaxID=930129 RepID=A0A1G8JPD1_9BACI|nr:short chain dehydrogenase [Alteribacillus bidgolensis]SDI32440.1 NAD(P)-dependent dehydrogenase, short-chain alcohol dehydrogenase family [Alteribacillus bidgolensis]